ncbi:MAG: hypothetical protein IJ761_03215 [Bacteroidales bacterium]|nr:hypothetical protein [Bacteroidales bacterium]
MNITNLIVELVKQGKSVELPGIGTFTGNMQQSHHDAEKHVFYPAGIKVSFDTATTGDEMMVDEIAKSEFISRDIARQMWQNYIDALGDRVKQNGSHRMGEMGVLTIDDNKHFSFAMTEEVLIPEGGQQPLYDVRTYEHANEEDPFAAYEPEDVPTIAPPKTEKEEPKVEEEPLAETEQEVDNVKEEPVVEQKQETETVVETVAEAEEEASDVAPVAEQEQETAPVVDVPTEADDATLEVEPVVEQSEESTQVVEDEPTLEASDEINDEGGVEALSANEDDVVVPDSDEEVVADTAITSENVDNEASAVEENTSTMQDEEVAVEDEKPADVEQIDADGADEGHNNTRKLDHKALRKEERLMRKAEKKANREKKEFDGGDDKDRLKAEKRAAALAAIAEKSQAKAAAKAEEEARKMAEMEAQMNAREQERIAKELEIKRLKEEQASAKEMKKLEKERQKAQKKQEKELKKLELEQQKEQKRLEAEQRKLEIEQQEKERLERKKLEKEQQKLQKDQAKKNKEAQQLADDLLNPVVATVAEDTDKEEGKRKRKCGWVVWVILLLCIVAAVAWWLCRGMCTTSKPSAEGQAKVESQLRKAYVESIDYSSRDIEDNSYIACRFVEPYVIEFLSQNNYTNARVPVMNRLQAYAMQRMNSLLGQRFAWIELVPYSNYVFDYNRADFKNSRANAARCMVQSELMNRNFLDSVLRQTIEKLGLQDDGTMQRTAEEVKKVQEQERAQLAKRAAAANNQLLRYVTVRGESKKGYDIVAGFYLNKHVAADLTARLYDMGCDAYIIEKNEYYYVSMGSAATRTEAEAQMKHIKEWYDGDVAIKQL